MKNTKILKDEDLSRIPKISLKDTTKIHQKKDFGKDSHDDQRSWQDLGKESWTASFQIVTIILKILKDPKKSLKTKVFENLH